MESQTHINMYASRIIHHCVCTYVDTYTYVHRYMHLYNYCMTAVIFNNR